MFRLVPKNALQQRFRSAAATATTTYRSSNHNIRFMSSVAIDAAAAATAVPSTKDILVNLTLVDPSGARRQIKGMIGKTLYDNCEELGIDLGPASVGAPYEVVRTENWTEPTFGEGVNSGFDMVVLVGNGVATAEPKSYLEDQMISDYWDEDEIFDGARLASAVTLTKEMDGMIVYIPDRLADDVP